MASGPRACVSDQTAAFTSCGHSGSDRLRGPLVLQLPLAAVRPQRTYSSLRCGPARAVAGAFAEQVLAGGWNDASVPSHSRAQPKWRVRAPRPCLSCEHLGASLERPSSVGLTRVRRVDLRRSLVRVTQFVCVSNHSRLRQCSRPHCGLFCLQGAPRRPFLSLPSSCFWSCPLLFACSLFRTPLPQCRVGFKPG